jgi:hypothetical protein
VQTAPSVTVARYTLSNPVAATGPEFVDIAIPSIGSIVNVYQQQSVEGPAAIRADPAYFNTQDRE